MNGIKVFLPIGEKFGRLTVTGERFSDKLYRGMVMCACECGKEKAIKIVNLQKGLTRSCGCLSQEVRTKTHTKHGQYKNPVWVAWMAMKNRCYNPEVEMFKHYGGRGISVCPRWLESFDHFAIDMGPRPTPKHSIDRIDVNGNYEPSNCRWATSKEQHRNRTNNIVMEYQGNTKTLPEWSEILGLSLGTLYGRLQRGWTVMETLSIKPFGRRSSTS